MRIRCTSTAGPNSSTRCMKASSRSATTGAFLRPTAAPCSSSACSRWTRSARSASTICSRPRSRTSSSAAFLLHSIRWWPTGPMRRCASSRWRGGRPPMPPRRRVRAWPARQARLRWWRRRVPKPSVRRCGPQPRVRRAFAPSRTRGSSHTWTPRGAWSRAGPRCCCAARRARARKCLRAPSTRAARMPRAPSSRSIARACPRR